MRMREHHVPRHEHAKARMVMAVERVMVTRRLISMGMVWSPWG